MTYPYLATRLSPCFVLVGVLIGGCVPTPPPSEDALLYYFKGFRVHGQVRRAWPEGQAYVDAVLNADAALQKELATLIELERVDSLWHADDAAWQNKAQRTKKTDELGILARGHVAECEVLLQALDRAIDDVPAEMPSAGSATKSDLTARVRDALALDGLGMGRSPWEIMPTLQDLVNARLELLRTIQAHAEKFDSTKVGLRFTDPEIEASILQAHAKVRDDLRLRRELLIAYAEDKLLASANRLTQIDRRSNPLEFQYLTDRAKYLRGELEDVAKRIRKQINALEKLNEKDAPNKAARIAELEAEWKAVKARVDATIAQPKAIGAETPKA